MNCISFSLSINHIFFFLIFVAFFFRELTIDRIDKLYTDDEKKKYTFRNSKTSTKKLFNMYVYTISNLFSFFAVCIVKIRSRRKNRRSNEIEEEHSSKSFNYIYRKSPINRYKLLIRTFLLTLFDFIAQCIVFLLYYIINNDSKFDVRDRLDMLCIFNILSKYIFSKIFLKSTNYYKHHYLSFAINFFCLIILGGYEFIKLEKTTANLLCLFIRILSQIIYSLEDVVGKMALIDEFLSPYTLLLYKGLYEIVLLLIFSIPFFIIKDEGSNIFSKMDVLIDNFTKVFLNIILMIMNFIYCIFIWIIIDRFSPNDYSMAMVIEGLTEKIFTLLFNTEKFTIPISIYVIIIYLILIFGICIYSEVIIINRCGLNEYTKQNFGNKGDIDYELTRKTERKSSFELEEEERRNSCNPQRATTREMEYNLNKLCINDDNDEEEKSRPKSISSFLFENLELVPEEGKDK